MCSFENSNNFIKIIDDEMLLKYIQENNNPFNILELDESYLQSILFNNKYYKIMSKIYDKHINLINDYDDSKPENAYKKKMNHEQNIYISIMLLLSKIQYYKYSYLKFSIEKEKFDNLKKNQIYNNIDLNDLNEFMNSHYKNLITKLCEPKHSNVDESNMTLQIIIDDEKNSENILMQMQRCNKNKINLSKNDVDIKYSKLELEDKRENDLKNNFKDNFIKDNDNKNQEKYDINIYNENNSINLMFDGYFDCVLEGINEQFNNGIIFENTYQKLQKNETEEYDKLKDFFKSRGYDCAPII